MNPKNIDEAIENLLIFMNLSDIKPIHGSKSQKIEVNAWDGAEPMLYLDTFLKNDIVNDNSLVFMDVLPSDLNCHFDQKLIVNSLDNEDDFSLIRYRTANPKKVRGLINRYCPIMVEMYVGYVNINKSNILTAKSIFGFVPDKNIKPKEAGYGFQNPGYWICLTTDKHLNQDNILKDSNMIRASLGWQFSRYYNWTVYLSFEGWSGLSFRTDPIGAREIFRLRDIPEGKKRRTALKHWVCEHYRKNRSISEVEKVKVIKHLRGANEFTWNGLKCKIMPSQYDLDLIDKLKA